MTMKKIIVMILSAILALFCLGCNIQLPSGNKNSSSSGKAENETVYLFKASESTAESFFNNPKTGAYIYGEYVSQDDLPGIFSADKLKEAVKVSHYSKNYKTYDKLYLKLDYTVSELEALKNTYKSAKFSIYFEAPPPAVNVYQLGGKHMMSYVETFNSGWNANQVHENVWSEYEISLDALILSMQTEETSTDNQTVYVFAGYCTDGRSQLELTMNVYISDFVLIEKLS